MIGIREVDDPQGVDPPERDDVRAIFGEARAEELLTAHQRQLGAHAWVHRIGHVDREQPRQRLVDDVVRDRSKHTAAEVQLGVVVHHSGQIDVTRRGDRTTRLRDVHDVDPCCAGAGVRRHEQPRVGRVRELTTRRQRQRRDRRERRLGQVERLHRVIGHRVDHVADDATGAERPVERSASLDDRIARITDVDLEQLARGGSRSRHAARVRQHERTRSPEVHLARHGVQRQSTGHLEP